MAGLLWLNEAQWAAIKPLLPHLCGRPRVDDRRVLSGLLHRFRKGLRSRADRRIRPPHDHRQPPQPSHKRQLRHINRFPADPLSHLTRTASRGSLPGGREEKRRAKVRRSATSDPPPPTSSGRLRAFREGMQGDEPVRRVAGTEYRVELPPCFHERTSEIGTLRRRQSGCHVVVELPTANQPAKALRPSTRRCSNSARISSSFGPFSTIGNAVRAGEGREKSTSNRTSGALANMARFPVSM